jgi:hypothetical protein
MSRVGLGRHGQLDSDAGDPLDGLVNLFDLGLVLAVGFLIAGLSLTVNSETKRVQRRTPPAPNAHQTTITPPSPKNTASGRGQAIGQVYRLPDGRLVLVGPGASAPSP